LRIERAAYVFDCAFRGGDALHFAQNAFAIVDQRAREQLLFMIDGHNVGALRRRQYSDNDADNGHGDDDANGYDHAQASAVPTRKLPRVGSARASHRRHDRCPLKRPAH
jgi:hypothetical protein